jgi:hypothetical protein
MSNWMLVFVFITVVIGLVMISTPFADVPDPFITCLALPDPHPKWTLSDIVG